MVVIDWEEVDRYLLAQCSGAEIASALGININTLYSHCMQEKGMVWGEYKLKMRTKGKADAKVDLYEKTYDNVPLKIFWCKHYLKMTDRVDMTTNGNNIQAPPPVIIDMSGGKYIATEYPMTNHDTQNDVYSDTETD